MIICINIYIFKTDLLFSGTETSMPSKYKRQPGSRRYADYTDEKLQECLEAVRTKQMTQREAESFYKISRATIKRKLKNQHINSPGHPKVFTTEEELAFASHLDKICDFGFPCDEIDFRFIVKAYLARQGRIVSQFKNNLPGRDWVKSFLNRHHQLAVRFAANIKRARASVDEKVITDYIENLSNELEGVPSANIYNYDESNMSDDPGRKKVICRRGCKYPERVINSTKSSISVMFCGNASGTALPPYIIYKAEHLWDTWTENGPLGARYNRSKHGWIDLAIFEEWFISHLLPVLKRQEGKKVIIGDNLTSHISVNVVKLCEENTISFICLPPNSTHLTQPLDIAYFRPLKMKWRDVLNRWKQSDAGKRLGVLPKDQFPMLLRTVLDELQPNMASNLKAGFKKAGIAPINKEEILQRVPNQDKHLNLSMVGEAFLEQLEQKRNEFVKPRPTKKKKLQVPAGKSICVSDLQVDENSSSVQDEIPSTSLSAAKKELKKCPKTVKPIKRKRKSEVSCSSTSEDEDAYSLHSGGESDVSVYNSEDEFVEHLPIRFGKSQLSETQSKQPSKGKQIPINKESLQVGNFVLVEWNGKNYPGVVQEIKDDGALVDCMEPTLKAWKWPEKKDILFYKWQDIVLTLTHQNR